MYLGTEVAIKVVFEIQPGADTKAIIRSLATLRCA
jgi:hypothetical protein